MDERKSEDDLVNEMKGKVKFLMILLKKLQQNDPKLKIVVLKPLLRNDNDMKQKIGRIVGEGEVKGARGSSLIVRSLPLNLETEIDQVRCNTKIYSWQMQCVSFNWIASLQVLHYITSLQVPYYIIFLQVRVFGKIGKVDETGRLVDNLHLRGVAGKAELTNAYISLLKSLM